MLRRDNHKRIYRLYYIYVMLTLLSSYLYGAHQGTKLCNSL
nr:hypothetical protein [Klebsiella michiganensis]